MKILSKVAARKSNTQFFRRGTSSQFRQGRRGPFPGRWPNHQTGFNQREKLIFQRPGPQQGEIPSCSTRSELCSTQTFPVVVASQSTTGMLPVKENLTSPKVKMFLSSLGLSSVEANHLPIAGRLQFFIENWQGVTNDPWVLSAISGHHIPFTVIPHQVFLPSHQVSVEDEPLIDNQLRELIQKQVVHLVLEHDYHTGFVSNLFAIPKKGGRQRPVFKVRQINQFIKYEHFKMEGIHMLRDLLKPNDFMAKIDLKDAYFTVPIWKDHQKLPRFLWKGTQWEFGCLPFGIASAPRVFMKILKPVIGLLRRQGIRPIIYLDDILQIASTKETLSYHVTLTVTSLEMLGFVVNYQKSQLNPTQSIEFLGFRVNSITLNISLPLDKVKGIRKECQKVLKNPDITIRELAHLLGKKCFDPGSIPRTPALLSHPSSQKVQSSSSWGL